MSADVFRALVQDSLDQHGLIRVRFHCQFTRPFARPVRKAHTGDSVSGRLVFLLRLIVVHHSEKEFFYGLEMYQAAPPHSPRVA
jgi:hypothetical protein